MKNSRSAAIAAVVAAALALSPIASHAQYNQFQQDQIRARLAQSRADRAASEAAARTAQQERYDQISEREEKRRASMPEPTECQLKSRYVEFVTANRQSGMPESAIPDLFGPKLDASWKERARHRIYIDANLALSDPATLGEQVYRECQAAAQAKAAQYRGAFSMPPKK
ncbi:hypothetical protein [Burkholderia dolosa]|uniref:hypothetical protein n=1 Tax=Burkholderia dolosa TaxID=152500 RepID=UPI0015907226|nr:hypothetical protein [Burkholderia dolosa]